MRRLSGSAAAMDLPSGAQATTLPFGQFSSFSRAFIMPSRRKDSLPVLTFHACPLPVKRVLPSGANDIEYVSDSSLNRFFSLPVAASRKRSVRSVLRRASVSPSGENSAATNMRGGCLSHSWDAHWLLPNRAIAPNGSGSPNGSLGSLFSSSSGGFASSFGGGSGVLSFGFSGSVP